MSTNKFKNRFNDTYESILKRYKKRVLFFIQKKWLSMGLVVASIVFTYVLHEHHSDRYGT